MSKKTYHHGNLRAALITAAHNILRSAGVEGLSLRKVAQQAGVSATAPYSHFKDKRELLAVLATQGFEQLAQEMQGSVSEREGWEGLACGYVTFATKNPDLFRLMFGAGAGDLMAFPELAAAGTRAYTLLSDYVAARMQELGAPHKTAIATAAAWSLVHGLSTLINDGRIRAADSGVPSNEALVEQMCAMLTFVG